MPRAEYNYFVFGTIDIKARPLRLAYLVDPGKVDQVRAAIRLSSTLWGGATFPIIALHKQAPASWKETHIKSPSAKTVILGYIEAYDPDVLVQLSKDVPDYISALGREVIKPERIWGGLGEMGRSLSPDFGLGIFEILNDVFNQHFRYKAKYPIRVVLPVLPKKLSLFWASVFGEVPLEIHKILQKRYFEPLDVEVPQFKPEQLGSFLEGNVLFPRRIAQHDLEYRNLPGFGRGASAFFMDAGNVEDVVDFWNLRAMGRTVLPIPKQLQNDPELQKVVESFFRRFRIPWSHNLKVCDHAAIIRSRHSSMEEMQEFAKTLKLKPAADDPSDSPFFALQHWYPRVWDEWARDKDGATPADVYGAEDSIEIDETTDRRIRFKALLPAFAEKWSHGEPRCANEVSFRLYGPSEFFAEVLPASPGDKVSRAISGITSMRGEWRVGRHGLVKLVKYSFSETRELPTAESIMTAWLEDQGWRPKISNPGLLAKQIYRHLGGHPFWLLHNEKLLGLFEHMNGGLVKGDGSPAAENRITQERDLPVGEVKNRLDDDRLYESLIEKGIFRLGLRVQCPQCRRNSWLPLREVRDTVSCPRCLNVFPAVGHLDAGTWSYKTTGPFSVPNYADGAYAVLAVLDFFSDHKMHTIHTTAMVSFTAEASGNKNLEADVGALWQESLYGEKKEGLLFCECKTYGQFEKKDFDRMRFLGKTFPGAVLAFATLRKSLTAKEKKELTRIAKAGRKYWKVERPLNPVAILTGTELLSLFGAPYCWEEPTKTKFSRVAGLLELCNATQQIYLGLPSWEAAWHDHWQKQLQKRQLREKDAKL